MEVDSSLIMTVITLSAGLIVATDSWFFRSKERGKLPMLVLASRWAFPFLAIIFLIRSFVVDAYEIPSESMQPGLVPGDYVAVNKWVYGIRLPIFGSNLLPIGEQQRGDVVVFRYPPHPTTIYIKRVIGLPGDSIRYNQGNLYVNDQLVVGIQSEGKYLENLNGKLYPIKIGDGLSAGASWSVTVAAGHYFVMGDNRDQSKDSRFWGPVPDANLLGKSTSIIMHRDEKGTTLSRNKSIL